MVNQGSRTYSTRNNEFLKYASQGAGLGHQKHCVLNPDYFPMITVDEGNTVSKRLCRKGQIIVKHVDETWGPLASGIVTEPAVTGDTELVVSDASVYSVGQELTIAGVTGTRTVTAIDLDTNTLTFSAAMGASVADNAAISFAALADDATDMAVAADEMDMTYGGRRAVGGYHLNCFFNTDNLIGYAGNEAAAQAGMPTCFFETLPDVTTA